MLHKIAVLTLSFAASMTLPLWAQDTLQAPAFTESQRQRLGDLAAGDHFHTGESECTPQPTSCGRREMGVLESSDCNFMPGTQRSADLYEFIGFEDQTVVIDMESDRFSTILQLQASDGSLVSTGTTSSGNDTSLVFDVPKDDTYTLVASSFAPFVSGPYSLSIRCEGTTIPGPCTPGPHVLCLANDRFAVTSTFTTTQESDMGNVERLTPDTGYLWFFDENNVEVVVKVLDTCAVPQFERFWFFAGGLTNVQTVIRVTDTEVGQFVDYVNNPQTPFQPIQDTDAFATCP